MSFSIVFKTATARMLDRQPGEKTEQLARRMVQEVLSSLGGKDMDPPALRIMNGVDEGKRVEITEDQTEITIGRMPECDLVLDDQNTSRRHCLIKRTWNGFTAQDLGSKNGVLLNGVRIEGPQNIKDGDEIQVGGVKLTFIDPASRILDQFGGFADETVNPPQGTGAAGEQGDSEDGEAEAQSYGGDEDGGQEESGGDSPQPEPEPPGADVDPEGAGGGAEADAIAPPEGGEVVAPSGGGIGAEVVILVLGLLFFLGAIGLAVFLYL
jgi:pSer/pThr/pTyr-binding forkhead associated (FHA) protein